MCQGYWQKYSLLPEKVTEVLESLLLPGVFFPGVLLLPPSDWFSALIGDPNVLALWLLLRLLFTLILREVLQLLSSLVLRCHLIAGPPVLPSKQRRWLISSPRCDIVWGDLVRHWLIFSSTECWNTNKEECRGLKYTYEPSHCRVRNLQCLARANHYQLFRKSIVPVHFCTY